MRESRTASVVVGGRFVIGERCVVSGRFVVDERCVVSERYVVGERCGGQRTIRRSCVVMFVFDVVGRCTRVIVVRCGRSLSTRRVADRGGECMW